LIQSLLQQFDRVQLGHLPTPIEYAERLTNVLGGPKIFFKRDDCTGLAFGGNKTRKLEFVMADAVKKKADVIITSGGLQSNWARQTAAAARKLGMDAILVLDGGKPDQYQGNLLLDHLLGCEIKFKHFTQEAEDAEMFGDCPVTSTVAEEIRKQGRTPYVVPLGAANPIGTLGYIAAVDELNSQLHEMGIESNYLVLAVGSGGTMAGLTIGLRLLKSKTRIIGISVSRHIREKEKEIADLCNQTAEFLGLDGIRFNPEEFTITYEYIGEGYAVPTAECIEAIRLVAETEGVFLDPVYTGKAMAGLIDLIQKGTFKKSDNVIFLHTGGNTANFAYAKYFQ